MFYILADVPKRNKIKTEILATAPTEAAANENAKHWAKLVSLREKNYTNFRAVSQAEAEKLFGV